LVPLAIVMPIPIQCHVGRLNVLPLEFAFGVPHVRDVAVVGNLTDEASTVVTNALHILIVIAQ